MNYICDILKFKTEDTKKTQPWCCVKQHDGYQRVQNHGEHQGDDVEQGDVREEHGDVHGTIA